MIKRKVKMDAVLVNLGFLNLVMFVVTLSTLRLSMYLTLARKLLITRCIVLLEKSEYLSSLQKFLQLKPTKSHDMRKLYSQCWKN